MTTFLDLQNATSDTINDERTEWLPDGTKIKKAINDAISEVYKKFANTSTGSTLLKSRRTEIIISNRECLLPTDFYESRGIFVNSTIIEPVDRDILPYEIKYDLTSGRFYLSLSFDIPKLYIEYIPNPPVLSTGSDELKLPQQLHRSVEYYAKVEYHRQMEDWVNVGNSLKYAEWKFQEAIGQIWID